jgi:hypothetical protein
MPVGQRPAALFVTPKACTNSEIDAESFPDQVATRLALALSYKPVQFFLAPADQDLNFDVARICTDHAKRAEDNVADKGIDVVLSCAEAGCT